MDNSKNSALIEQKANVLGFKNVKMKDKLCMHLTTCLVLA